MVKNTHPTEVLDIEIQSLTTKGEGFSRYIHPADRGSNGKHLKLYVRNTVPGDIVRVTVSNAKGRRRAALDYDELLKPSPQRNLAIPLDRGRSAGAPLQYMTYASQLQYKEGWVQEAFQEAGFGEVPIEPIIGMEDPNRYRNKMELTFSSHGHLGMHQQGDYQTIIDLEDSILAPEIMVEIKETISLWQARHQLPGYHKDLHQGLLRNLMIRESHARGEVMVVIYATESPESYPEARADLVRTLTQEFPQLASLQWHVHQDIGDRIGSDKKFILSGRDFIYDELAGFTYRIWPETFFQANAVQAEEIVRQVLDMAQVDKTMRVLDLFCGVGTFSLPLARASKDLAGIEIVPASIEAARRNTQDNQVDNTFFLVSDARSGLKQLPDLWGLPDLLVLDPPRGGAGGKVMRAIGRMEPEKIIYVSCNPKSLAQDLKWLPVYGYEIQTIQPVDQFCHTAHVESIVLMRKGNE